jgi:hypothetical protein
MSYLSDQMNQLQGNIRTGGMTSVQMRKSPIEINRDVGPTSSLDDDPFSFASISYPKDVTQDRQNGHYMLFYVNVQNKTKFIYNPYEKTDKIGVFKQTFVAGNWETSFEPGGTTNAPYRDDLIQKGGTGTVYDSDNVDLRKSRKGLTGFNSVLSTTTRITDSIAIYLPPNVTSDTGVEYTDTDMGIVGMAAAGGVDLVNAIRRDDLAGAGTAIMNVAKKFGVNAAKRIIGGVVGAAADVDSAAIGQFAEKAFGQATNPFMEVLFQGVGMRSFTYNFTFSPRNPDETNDVQTIIKMFRFHMLPELQGQNKTFMTLPSTFDIHYMYQGKNADIHHENQFYTKIATCVLKGCNVDYTPDGVKSFDSGAPTQIKMSLVFQETEMLTKQHVAAGF